MSMLYPEIPSERKQERGELIITIKNYEEKFS